MVLFLLFIFVYKLAEALHADADFLRGHIAEAESHAVFTLAAAFGEEESVKELYNVIRKKKKFAGFVRYETEFAVPGEGMDRREYGLDLGQVGEVAYVWVDGQKAGERIVPPYRFRFTAIPGKRVKLCVVTTSHLGYEQQDHFSSYVPFEPVGLLGPVTVEG